MTGKKTNTADTGIGKARLRGRYKDAGVARQVSDLPWNETLDVLLSHRSVRSYLNKPVPDGYLELIMAAAQSAPTTSNLQAWSVVAVQDPARKARLATIAAGQKHIVDAPLLLVFIADLARLRKISASRGQPAVALDYVEAFIFAVADAAFAAQNAVVAIESLGLGCCYIGAIRNDPFGVGLELNLPDETLAVFGLTVGIPDPAVATEVKPRLPQPVVLHRETYGNADEQHLAAYDRWMREFQSEQNMRVADWRDVSAQRVKDEEALTGRHVMTDYLRSHGFKLL